MYSLPLFYEDIRLQKYSIISNGQKWNSITDLVSAVPEEKDLSPYYYYNFNNKIKLFLKMEKIINFRMYYNI